MVNIQGKLAAVCEWVVLIVICHVVDMVNYEYTHWETLSEQEILDQYYDYWSSKMILPWFNDNEDISKEKCIEDWCIVHWAERNYWREMKDCIA